MIKVYTVELYYMYIYKITKQMYVILVGLNVDEYYLNICRLHVKEPHI